MKQIKVVFAYLLLLGLLEGCILDNVFDCVNGRGDIIEEEFGLDQFNELRLAIDADVFITQAEDHQIKVIAQANVIDELNFRIRNRTLTIDNHHCLRDFKSIEIYVTMAAIEALQISGSGSIRGENVFLVGDIDLEISGSGDMNIGLEAEEITAKISGSGDLEMDGEADQLDFRVSGSGNLSAFDLPVSKCDIMISGSGDAEVTVSDFLDVRISGSGDVFYKGDPRLDVRTSGSGQVIDAN